MQKVYDVLMHNNTLSMVDTSPCEKVIGNRWLFKTKEKNDGSHEK